MERKGLRLWAVVFWIVIWQGAAFAVGEELLLPGPVAALKSLMEMVRTGEFWQAVTVSTARIFGGFFLAALSGTAMAACAWRLPRLRELLQPVVTAATAIPVASFILIALMVVSSVNLSVLIAFLMAFPPIYGNVIEGCSQVDSELIEMAQVFRVGGWRRIRGIYLPCVLPYFRSACALSIGLCWKAGVAAEILGLPDGSVGEKLYLSKIYFETSELFAWTAVVVGLSALCQRLVLWAIGVLCARVGGA